MIMIKAMRWLQKRKFERVLLKVVKEHKQWGTYLEEQRRKEIKEKACHDAIYKRRVLGHFLMEDDI